MRVRGLTLIELLIALAIALVVLRVVFAGALRSYENQLFAALGIGESAQLLLILPLAACAWYLRYRRGNFSGRVPSWLVICGVCVIVFGVGAFAWLLAA